MSGIGGWVWCCLFGAMGGQWLELAGIQLLLQLSDSANCVSYSGAGRRARCLQYFLAFKESKNGTLFKCMLESIFLHLQVKSLPLPKDAHHCLTNKYIKVHLCLKSLILLHVSFSAEISVREPEQGKWCCSAARGVGLPAELPSGV